LRIETGIHGFDELIQGGLIKNRVYLLSGPPGSGKTTFCVQFLSTGGTNKEPGMYVSLSESVENIMEDMSNYHFKIKGLVNLGRIIFFDLGPELEYGLYDSMYSSITLNSEGSVGNDPELSAPTPTVIFDKIAECVKKNNIERLVIDSLSSIRFSTENIAQADKEINRFVRNLKKLGCTTFLISDMTNPNSYSPEHFASHGVIFLHHYLDEKTKSMLRAIQVIKMRGTKHDSNLMELSFTSDGLNVDKIPI